MANRTTRVSVPPIATGQQRGLDWPVLAAAGVIAAAAIAAYSQTFSVPFHFDDQFAIAENATIRHWSTALWPPPNTTASGRPMLNLSLALNYALSGQAVWSYHALNLVIHVLAGLTLFAVVRRTLAPQVAAPAAARIAFAAALLWSLHPLQTEAVTYLVQRAESMMGLFYLLTLYCYLRAAAARSAGRRVWGALAIGSCLLGMATKEVMVSAPLIVLFYDRTFLAGSFREAVRRRGWLLAGLAATWTLLPFLVLATQGRSGTSGFGSGISFARYGLTQFPAIGHYLRLSFWPHPLVFDYGTRWVAGLAAVWPSALIVSGLIGATAWALGRKSLRARACGFAGMWFFAILAPTSLVPGNRQTAAEHRMYLALIPVIVLTVVGLFRLLGRGALPVCLLLAAVLFGVTWQRNQVYGSTLALWRDTVAANPDNPWAHDYLGSAEEEQPGGTREAIAQYEEALRLKPDLAEAHNNLGEAWMKLPGRLQDGIAQCEEALRLKPGLAEAHNNLGEAYLQLPGGLEKAIAECEAALRLKPDFAHAHNNLGNAWLRVPGRLNDAIAQYEEALRLDPQSAEIHNNLGCAWLQASGRLGDAIAELETAIKLNPNFAKAHYNLGNAWVRLPERFDAGIAQYEESLRLAPDSVETRNNLGLALEKKPGRLDEAIAQFRAAVRLDPDEPLPRFNLAIALLKGQTGTGTAEATAQLEAVVRLQPANDSARKLLAQLRALQTPAGR